jgi:hypothetical protein
MRLFVHFRQIYDPGLSQYAYLIGCDTTNKAILVDPERDVDRYLKIADDLGLTIRRLPKPTSTRTFFREGVGRTHGREGLFVPARGGGWLGL